ncbi:flagellar filament capping protein FliD [Massilia sp. W12]|uniref:flagellar filament capping protein FliD n=1 Tax=Massilia sp. W12 TaxID=3126507 RepID=UPI0030D276B5
MVANINNTAVMNSLSASSVSSGGAAASSASLGASSSPTSVSPEVLARISRTLAAQSAQAPKLNAALNQDRAKLSGLGQLQSALSGLQDVLQGVRGEGLSTSAVSGNSKVLNALGSAKATAGTYAVQVRQLAQGQVLQSKTVKDADLALAADVPTQIRFELGSSTNGVFKAGKENKSITINPTGSSLSSIVQSINDANFGVKASVVKVGASFALSLASPSGSKNELKISVTGDSNLQKLLAYDPNGAKALTETVQAQDAKLSVNGKEFTSSSNTVSDAVQGVSLKLVAKGQTDVVVSRDNQQVIKNVNNLVSSFNSLNAKVRSLQQNELKNERAPGLVQDQLLRVLKTASVTGSDGFSLTLDKIGISVQKNGDLQVDQEKLKNAVNADPAAVAQLFTSSNSGLAESLDGQIKALTGNGGSISRDLSNISKNISSLNQKKDSLSKALALQANMLARQYSQQSGVLGDGGQTRPGNLFDILG